MKVPKWIILSGFGFFTVMLALLVFIVKLLYTLEHHCGW